ncbi:leucine-rich repeat extensin-like protein 5 [Sapajus apella]|uniref:Leucine-rich repeat extensin-like protein 5 n=1 Tax=Sapajus apella TaxID=9515 RepID=A0A6J3F470_SAPAP|nr:leucine-rich repeat extensin-like protein 5 [Sapajus apella]
MTGKLPPISQFQAHPAPGLMIPHPPNQSRSHESTHSRKLSSSFFSQSPSPSPSHLPLPQLPLPPHARPLPPLQKYVDFSVFCPICYPTVAYTCPPHYPTIILYLPCSSAIRHKSFICQCRGPRTLAGNSPIDHPGPHRSPPRQGSGPRTLPHDSPTCPSTPPPSPACRCRPRAVSWDFSTYSPTPPP